MKQARGAISLAIGLVVLGLVGHARYTSGNASEYVPPADVSRAHEHARAQGTRIFIAINADCDTARRLGPALAQTWANPNTLPSYITARIIIGDSAKHGRASQCMGSGGDGEDDEPHTPGTSALERSLVTYLPWCPDSYPPVAKVMCMWTYIRTTWADAYTHFAKVDADSHINIDNLARLLASLNPASPAFAGAVGQGRGDDRGRVQPFCLGPAYFLTRALLRKLPDRSPQRGAVGDVRTHNDDQEDDRGEFQFSTNADINVADGSVQRPFFGDHRFALRNLPPNSDRAFSHVISELANVSCMHGVPPEFKWAFMNRYWDIAPQNGSIIYPVLAHNKQTTLPVLHPFYSSFVRAVSVHSFKTGTDMRVFHAAARAGRLPLFRTPIPVPDEVSKILRPMCVFNPARQYELAALNLRECPVHEPGAPPLDLGAVRAHIIHLPHRFASAQRAQNLSRVLRDQGVHTVIHDPGVDGIHHMSSWMHNPTLGGPADKRLSAGEAGLRAAYANAIASALHQEQAPTGAQAQFGTLHLFLEDDAILARDFGRKLHAMLTSNRRCGTFMSVAPSGALLLGGTVWREGTYPRASKWTSGWLQIDKEVGALKSTADKACYNVANGTYGTFAWLAHSNTLSAMLAWLHRPDAAHRPVDHVWPALADAGFVVRALNPPLAIARLDDSIIHTSSTHKDGVSRMDIHRWQTFA